MLNLISFKNVTNHCLTMFIHSDKTILLCQKHGQI